MRIRAISWQQTIVVGHLGRDPELRFPSERSVVCNFSVAVNERWRDRRTSEHRTRTTWYRVSAWGNKAESCSKTLRKGNLVLVVGQATTSVFTRKDGQSAVSLNLRAKTVSLLGPNRGPQGRTRSPEKIAGQITTESVVRPLADEDEKKLSENYLFEDFTENEYFDNEQPTNVWDEIPSMDDYVWVNNLGWDSWSNWYR